MIRTRPLASAADLDPVFELPRRLYANDPAWVAPVEALERRRMRGFLDDGRLRVFTAEQNGVVIGTISALRDPGYERHKGEKVAWFGYFEAVDDPAVVAALIERVAEQAREWGCDRLRGPRNLTRFEAMGLTVEGHGVLPPFMQGHHSPGYQGLLERLGFEKHHDVIAYETPVMDALGRKRELPEPLRTKSRDCDIPGLEVRSAARRHLGRDLRDAHAVLNTAFETVPDIAPMPLSQFMALGRTYLTVADPRLIQVARRDGTPIGFAATFPELNEALQAMRGQVLPLGWLRTALAMRQIHTASFKLIGVVPEYRGTGLHARLIDHVIEGVKAAGYTRLEASVVDERNAPMRAVIEGAGMTPYRRYRLYERAA
jgi:GNAT superfamily N-acetyltransferase